MARELAFTDAFHIPEICDPPCWSVKLTIGICSYQETRIFV